MSQSLRILSAVKRRWLTASEIAAQLGHPHLYRVRVRLQRMASDGYLRMRTRQRQPTGRRVSGPLPREYRVSTQWGGLDP